MNFRLLVGFLTVPLAHAQDQVIDPVIHSVAMFKNGLTVVHSSFEVEGPGDYTWVEPPTAVHGAFFVESDPGMVIRSTTRMMDEPARTVPTGNLQTDLAGATVRLSVHGESGRMVEEVRGQVWSVPLVEQGAWNTNYATTNRNARYSVMPSQPTRTGAMGYGGWLVVQSGAQRRFIASSRIGQISIEKEPEDLRKRPKPVLVFSARKEGKVLLTYLSKGMAWAPSYQVDLLENDRMRLRQSAVVRNELMPLENTKVDLISGYPNVQFGHVDSPLSPQATLASFFQQVSQRGGGQADVMSQQVVFNNITSNDFGRSAPLPQPDAGAPAEDLHYESIGVHDLREGDSLSLEVARAETSCERIVQWQVPDYRDDYGRLRRNRGDREEDEPWDAIQFSNPLKFPMTTAVASVLENNRFRGQSLATWTAPGQRASIKINKALTVRGEHSEVEEEGGREVVWIAGDDFQRTTVKGYLKVSNTRAESVKMVIHADFSGELIEADADPVKSLRVDGARSVNPHRQLEWTLELAAGEVKSLTYRYAVLVNR